MSAKCSFALRSYERAYERDYRGPLAVQKDKWRRLKRGLTDENVVRSQNLGESDEEAFRRWDQRNTLACAALTFSSSDPKHLRRTAEKLISAGIPLGIWFREPRDPANGWWDAIKEHFIGHPCSHWPPRALEFHARPEHERSPACTGLVLMWDNPEQPVPRLPGRNETPLQAPASGSKS